MIEKTPQRLLPLATRSIKRAPNAILASLVAKDAGAQLKASSRLARRQVKRQYLDALFIENACKSIGQLPARGESLHCITRGNHNGWSIVPAVMQLSGQVLDELRIATLGFHKTNVEALLELLDTDQAARAMLVCSVFHEAHERELCQWAARELGKRHCTFLACRSHAKILLMQAGSNHFVFEGSANLQSCRMIEQFCLSNCAELFQFHARWMDELVAKRNHDQEKATAGQNRQKRQRKDTEGPHSQLDA